jgi:hypothetical protein
MARSVRRQTFLVTVFFDLDGGSVGGGSSRPYRRGFIVEADDESSAVALARRRLRKLRNLGMVPKATSPLRILRIECHPLE